MNGCYGIGRQEGIGLGKTLEGWNGKIIPTQPSALSDYLKGISL